MNTTIYTSGALALLFASAAAWAQAPAWQSVTTTNNTTTTAAQSNSFIRATATDASGNVFVVGGYTGTITLGNFTLAAPTTTYGLFVAKWSPATNAYVWVQQASGVSPNAIAVSGTSIYIAGFAAGYTPSALGTTTFAAGANDTGFIAKLTDSGSSGSFVWAQELGGQANANVGIMGLAVSGTTVYATGSFVTNTASFGTYTLSNNSTAAQWLRPEEIYLAKLTDAGAAATVAWVQQAPASSGAKNGWPYGVATSGSSVYLTGNGSQSFVAKFTDAGSFQWTIPFGGIPSSASLTIPASLTARGSDVYVAGRFLGSATFGNTTLVQPAGAATFSSDVFVMKLHDNGPDATQGWALQAGGTDIDSATAIVTSPNGLYVAGVFKSPTASFGSTTVTSAGDADAYVARIVESSSGASFAWTLPAGGSLGDGATGVALSGSNVYVVGHAGLPAQFGALSVPMPANPSNYTVGFLARLTDTALPARAANSLAEDALYPNPAHGTTSVRVPGSAGAATLTLLDAVGRVVRTQPATAGTTAAFDLAGLAPGLYVLRVQAGEALAVRQLVVE